MRKMVAFKRLMSATLLKRRLWHRCFSCDFCQICKNAFFTEHIWATASILRGGRRLKQTEISIISKLTTKIIKKKKCSHIFYFLLLLILFLFGLQLYSYFPYVQTCWIWKTYFNNTSKIKKNMLIFKFHPVMKCLHVFFSFFRPGMKFHLCFSSRDEI